MSIWGVVNVVILFDQHNIQDNIYEIVFSTTQQIIVSRVLVDYIKQKGGEVSKSELSQFATKLNEGKVVTKIDEEPFIGKQVKLSYNKRQFYDRILTPMRGMGIIDYDLYKKTYKLSNNFCKAIEKIGDLWKGELEKESLQVHFDD